MTPDAPTLRGTAQNPDVFFQAREAANPYYDAVPGIVTEVFDELAARTGRRYGLVDYVGATDAERVIVLMGSAAGAATEAVETMTAAGREGRSPDRPAVPPVPGGGLARRPAADDPRDRRARPHQGAGRRRRAALPRCRSPRSPKRPRRATCR